jgi:shikimate kinase
MTQPVATTESIILIGPMKAGKTTVGKQLAQMLSCSFVSLDRLERTYTEACGFDAALAADLSQKSGAWAGYSYRRQFFAEAVARFLTEYTNGVLELGGGHPIAPDAEQQSRIEEALQPHRNVVLLLPSRDKEESLATLRSRQKPEHLGEGDWNEAFLKGDQFVRLAKYTVYTAGKSPTATCEEIIKWVMR